MLCSSGTCRFQEGEADVQREARAVCVWMRCVVEVAPSEGGEPTGLKLQRIKPAAGGAVPSGWQESGVCLFFSRSVIHQGDFRTGVGEERDGGNGKRGGITLFRVAVLSALD